MLSMLGETFCGASTNVFGNESLLSVLDVLFDGSMTCKSSPTHGTFVTNDVFVDVVRNIVGLTHVYGDSLLSAGEVALNSLRIVLTSVCMFQRGNVGISV